MMDRCLAPLSFMRVFPNFPSINLTFTAVYLTMTLILFYPKKVCFSNLALCQHISISHLVFSPMHD